VRLQVTMKKTIIAKVNTNVVDNSPKDLRNRFLAKENLKLLKAVTRFATDYVQGVLRVNDIAQMRQINSKISGTEAIKGTTCQGVCQKNFTRANAKYLYVVIDSTIEVVDETKRWNKFKFVCLHCSNKYAYDAQFYVIQLYPQIALTDAELLCKLGFLTKYIFPIDLNYTTVTNTTRMEGTHDFFAFFNSIVRNKHVNEQITMVRLQTYGRDLFTETDRDVVMKSAIDVATGKVSCNLEFYPKQSTVMEFLKTYTPTKSLTYFYEVSKRIYKNSADYVIYFPIKCQTCCKLCTKNKVYNTINPVLYCSLCGFTDAMFFSKSAILGKVTFDINSVKIKSQKPSCIAYYDMADYKLLINKIK
jgi:Baculoviridae ME53